MAQDSEVDLSTEDGEIKEEKRADEMVNTSRVMDEHERESKAEAEDEPQMERSRSEILEAIDALNVENDQQLPSTEARPEGSADHPSRTMDEDTNLPDYADQPSRSTYPSGPLNVRLRVSGGTSPAARRRQRRAESDMATVRGILLEELREEERDRARVLRVAVKQLVSDLGEVADIVQKHQRQREFQKAVVLVRRVAAKLAQNGRGLDHCVQTSGQSGKTVRVPAVAKMPEQNDQGHLDTDEEWARRVQQFEARVPQYLEEIGSLEEMRAVRRLAKRK